MSESDSSSEDTVTCFLFMEGSDFRPSAVKKYNLVNIVTSRYVQLDKYETAPNFIQLTKT